MEASSVFLLAHYLTRPIMQCIECSRGRKRLFMLFIIVCVVYLWLNFMELFRWWPAYNNDGNIDFTNFNNVSGAQGYIVPNIVHFVIFGKQELSFISFLSMLSALKVQHPDKLLIHSDSENFSGRYWDILQSFSNGVVKLNVIDKPTHIFGQPITSLYHISDITRIRVLQKFGGIYLDVDSLVLRTLDWFRHFEMVVGWPIGDSIGTQVLIAHHEARFLKLWLNSYRKYYPYRWYYNAGEKPAEILKLKPELVHRVPELFGVQNLALCLYGKTHCSDWRKMYTVHLLIGHKFYLVPESSLSSAHEFSILNDTTTFSEIARWILYELEPVISFPSLET